MNAAQAEALIEHIEAQCNDMTLCAGDLADNILAVIQASREITPAQAQACAECIELRGRLVNIYHLTLTYADPSTALRAVRAASGPGASAPAPAARGSDA